MDHAELSSSVVSRVILPLWHADVSEKIRRRPISHRTERAIILSYLEKKYCILVREIREGRNVSYLLCKETTHKGVESRSFEVGKYTNEHMMRHFARYLNRGRLSRENIDETIIEMKSLQFFCR
ncbi:MAG: hypothetical protein NC211_03920 [Alistipes senegalensis]|nr:hypothetical protein [Oxalobacter formigenes]MCM1280964.1 hypothetical protein [Alistipes senegalensis]